MPTFDPNYIICYTPYTQVLFQVALMILKFIEQQLLASRDEAEAIKVLNDFLSNIGKRTTQEVKVQDEEVAKVGVM